MNYQEIMEAIAQKVEWAIKDPEAKVSVIDVADNKAIQVLHGYKHRLKTQYVITKDMLMYSNLPKQVLVDFIAQQIKEQIYKAVTH